MALTNIDSSKKSPESVSPKPQRPSRVDRHNSPAGYSQANSTQVRASRLAPCATAAWQRPSMANSRPIPWPVGSRIQCRKAASYLYRCRQALLPLIPSSSQSSPSASAYHDEPVCRTAGFCQSPASMSLVGFFTFTIGAIRYTNRITEIAFGFWPWLAAKPRSKSVQSNRR